MSSLGSNSKPPAAPQNDERAPLLARENDLNPANGSSGSEEQPEQTQGFTPQLNALNGYALLIGVIIGSGIFASPSAVDTNVPSPGAALLIWLLGGLLAFSGAATLAELGTTFPGDGGIQEYLKYIYGDFAGFLAAWAWITAVMPCTLSILSIVFVETVYNAAKPGGSEGTATGWMYKGLAVGVLVVTVLLNCVNTRTSAVLGNFFVVTKLLAVGLLVLAGIVVAGIYAGDHSKDYGGKDWHERGWFEPRTSYTPGGEIDWRKVSTWESLGHYSAAIYASLWAYSGWDKANYIASELTNPSRQLPLALNTAIPTVIISYVLVNAAYYILIPWKTVGLTDAIAVTAMKSLLGKAAGIIFAILVCLVIFGALNSNVLVTGRLTVAAANKRYVPTFLGNIGRILRRNPSKKPDDENPKNFDAPFNAFLLTIIITSLYILLGNFRALLTFNGLAEYLFFFLTVLGDIILRWREPGLERPVRPPVVVPVLFAVVSGFVVVRGAAFAPVQFGVLGAELAVGTLWYWGGRWWVERVRRREGREG